ncbi:hypothetical protein CPBF426_02830 [Xanthomonas arboricola pv. juglandis]|uniref:Uncharacterized protein n=1 Tax=Xanthomonas euroxanthea TaxID=2259622 RepID=A0AA46C9H4_9XANT|nr:hypothetical protein CPBF424_27200 [Xanthomonas euroxanthea]SYZ50052.1 hypothetical protein CPBF426_02830 [Xanthomonas arboricola pv. juglandis]SYZ53181.1 hypothetical protein CPBF367_12430 [Xanthomonas arboricola pv. juglandis]
MPQRGMHCGQCWLDVETALHPAGSADGMQGRRKHQRALIGATTSVEATGACSGGEPPSSTSLS